jgi:decaprenylphospho-beta-D-erythro-pentofuranosid-2-ulose 2-reductase
VQNSFGEPQTILLLGGNSEIGLAIVRKLVTPTLRHVVLAVRRPAAAEATADDLRRLGIDVSVVEFDAATPDTHSALIADVAARVGDIDVAVLAFGVLGEQGAYEADPALAARVVSVNYSGSVSSGLALAEQMRSQGHGHIVVLSSVAGERVRKANFVYGSSKAGQDGFAQGLGDSLAGTGVHVLIVRPGFVTSQMTAGMEPAPFSTTPDAVAEATVRGLRSNARVVWVPGVLRYVFSLLRHVPAPIFRRLPLG